MSRTTITVGGNEYISYASVAEADIALAVDPTRMIAWAALTEVFKGIRLIAATNRLDLLRWQGEKAGGVSQLNQWPRSGLVYRDGESLPDDVIPPEIERATILLAGSIASTPAHSNVGTSSTATKRVKAGSAEVEFFHRQESVAGKPIQDETVFELVRQWLEGSNVLTGSTGPLATGTDGESSFEGNRFGRSEGFS